MEWFFLLALDEKEFFSLAMLKVLLGLSLEVSSNQKKNALHALMRNTFIGFYCNCSICQCFATNSTAQPRTRNFSSNWTRPNQLHRHNSQSLFRIRMKKTFQNISIVAEVVSMCAQTGSTCFFCSSLQFSADFFPCSSTFRPFFCVSLCIELLLADSSC